VVQNIPYKEAIDLMPARPTAFSMRCCSPSFSPKAH